MRIHKQKRLRDLSFLGYLFFALLPLPFIKVNDTFTGASILGIVLCGVYVLHEQYYVNKYMMLVTLLFVCGELLSITICTDISKTLIYTIQKLIVVLVVYPLMRKMLKTPQSLLASISTYRFTCVAIAVVALFTYIVHANISFIGTKYSMQRLTITGLGPNVIARLFCVGAFIALYEAQIKKSFEEKFLSYMQYIVLVLAIAVTLSTSGIILLVLGTLLIYLSYNEGVRKIGIVKLLIVIAVVLIVFIAVYHKIEFVHSQVTKLIIRELSKISMDAESGGFSLHGRMEGLENYWSNAVQYLFIGVGYGCSSVINGVTIHFPILASLLETGILGFASCLLLYGHPLKSIYEIWNNKNIRIYGIISLVILIGDMVQPNPNYIFTWFAIFLACCAQNIPYKKMLENDSK